MTRALGMNSREHVASRALGGSGTCVPIIALVA